MSGLSLRVAGYGGAAAGSGAPMPVAANNPSSTISQQAFGITSGGGSQNAANGALGAGALAAGLLAWLWWTLPR